MSDLELWCVKYTERAYQDQTGKWQRGYVVKERVEVRDTGARYDVDDGYAKHANHGRVYEDDTKRRFKVHTETVDYSGADHVQLLGMQVGGNGFYWHTRPRSAEGYVTLDGDPVVSVGNEE